MLKTIGRVRVKEIFLEKYEKVKLPDKKTKKCWYIKGLRYNGIWEVAYLLGFNNNIRCIEILEETKGAFEDFKV